MAAPNKWGSGGNPGGACPVRVGRGFRMVRGMVRASVGATDMLIWTGRGGIAGALILLQVLGVGIGGLLLGFGDVLASSPWIWLVGGFVNAAICWMVGRRVNRGLEPRVIDYIHDGNRSFALGHTFYFVRLEYCGVITVAASVFFFLVASGRI